MRRLAALTITTSLALYVSGCDSCSSEKPYTPFGVTSSIPKPPSAVKSVEAPPAVETVDAGEKPAPRKSLLVSPGQTTYEAEGLKITAPEGREFAQVLLADFDADTRNDVVAWVTPPKNNKQPQLSELWFYSSAGAKKKIAALPSFIPTGPTCEHKTELEQTSPKSVTLDIVATCETALVPRAPNRALMVLSPAAERSELISLRIAPPATGETLKLAIDSSDSDADGREDVRLTVTVGKQGGETASADLAWFDRTLGPSRNATEPASSLNKAAQAVASRAKNKKTLAATTERLNAVRRLMSSLCGESSVSRIFDVEGTPLRCGDVARTIDQLAQAEANLALTRGDVLGALSVLNRDGWYFRKISDAAKKTLEKDLRKALSVQTVASASGPKLRAKLGKLPQWSPLWFEADGSLLVQSDTSLTRVSKDSTSEQLLEAEDSPPKWPLDVVSDSGARFIGVGYSCDRSEVELLFTEPSGMASPMATELMSPRPGLCRGTREFSPPIPVAYGQGIFQALISGFLVSSSSPGAAQSLPQPGSARSGDGKWLVQATPLGIAVIGERKELWDVQKLTPEQADTSRLSHCVVANGASAVACVRDGKVVHYLRP